MKIYITASFKDGNNKDEIEQLCGIVRRSGFEEYCFVRDEKDFVNEHEMMQRAKEEIEKCDALLIKYDGPTHGRMIELGIAYAMNKKTILITKKGTPIKDTVRGVIDSSIEYEELEDSIEPMSKLLIHWKKQ
ncbi:MAG: nucleoside 2-deoxyribosyltransferase [candidate division SR1 bacterium]|nr:nucleoside 2-deoxyribosyltransferase [candidate division SR1 bacterium]